jgi:hypothetical protein
MMELYIKLDADGNPTGHPMLRSNLETAWPHIDFDNLPDDLAPFVRVEDPKRSHPYEVVEGSYQWDGDVVKDVYTTREMTPSERSAQIAAVQATWADDTNTPSDWVFDEVNCCHVPPVPYPDDGNLHVYSMDEERWVQIEDQTVDLGLPPYPTDGKLYKWSDLHNTWVIKDMGDDTAPPEAP